MAQITWRNVNAPEFGSAANILSNAGRDLNSGFGGISQIFQDARARQIDERSNEALGTLAGVSSGSEVDAALASVLQGTAARDRNGALNSAIAGLRGTALGYDNTRSTIAARGAASARAAELHDLQAGILQRQIDASDRALSNGTVVANAYANPGLINPENALQTGADIPVDERLAMAMAEVEGTPEQIATLYGQLNTAYGAADTRLNSDIDTEQGIQARTIIQHMLRGTGGYAPLDPTNPDADFARRVRDMGLNTESANEFFTQYQTVKGSQQFADFFQSTGSATFDTLAQSGLLNNLPAADVQAASTGVIRDNLGQLQEAALVETGFDNILEQSLANLESDGAAPTTQEAALGILNEYNSEDIKIADLDTIASQMVAFSKRTGLPMELIAPQVINSLGDRRNTNEQIIIDEEALSLRLSDFLTDGTYDQQKLFEKLGSRRETQQRLQDAEVAQQEYQAAEAALNIVLGRTGDQVTPENRAFVEQYIQQMIQAGRVIDRLATEGRSASSVQNGDEKRAAAEQAAAAEEARQDLIREQAAAAAQRALELRLRPGAETPGGTVVDPESSAVDRAISGVIGGTEVRGSLFRDIVTPLGQAISPASEFRDQFIPRATAEENAAIRERKRAAHEFYSSDAGLSFFMQNPGELTAAKEDPLRYFEALQTEGAGGAGPSVPTTPTQNTPETTTGPDVDALLSAASNNDRLVTLTEIINEYPYEFSLFKDWVYENEDRRWKYLTSNETDRVRQFREWSEQQN